MRPSFDAPTVTLRCRQPHVEVGGRQRVEIEQLPVPVARAAGEQAEGGDIRREVERVGGERRLQRLAAVIGVGHHALGDVAVELDIDVGERDRGADDIGARLQREAAEAAAAGRRPPVQRSALRKEGLSMVSVPSIIGLVRSATLPSKASLSGALAIRAFSPERSPERAATKSRRDRAVDALAAPVELPGRGEGARDRGPGQRQVDVLEVLGGVGGGVLVIQHAVLDPDLGERHRCRRRASWRADGLDEGVQLLRRRRRPTWIAGAAS